jgi:hypothetical protein
MPIGGLVVVVVEEVVVVDVDVDIGVIVVEGEFCATATPEAPFEHPVARRAFDAAIPNVATQRPYVPGIDTMAQDYGEFATP